MALHERLECRFRLHGRGVCEAIEQLAVRQPRAHARTPEGLHRLYDGPSLPDRHEIVPGS